MTPDHVSVVLRALSLIALLQAVGASLFAVLFGRYSADSMGPIRGTAGWSALAGGALLVAQYAIEAARMADDWSGIMDPALQSLALKSAGGAALVARILGLSLVSAGLRLGTSGARTVTAIGAILTAGSFALTGHTSEHPLRALLAPILVVHVLAIAFWLGSLIPLYLTTARESAARAARVVEAFSALATWLVPGIAVAGALMTLLLVRRWAVFLTPYGWLLIAKVTGFVALMGLAALNKWRLGPAVATGDRGSQRAFCLSVATEYALVVAVLAATAVMTTLFSPDPSQ